MPHTLPTPGLARTAYLLVTDPVLAATCPADVRQLAWWSLKAARRGDAGAIHHAAIPDGDAA